MPLDLKPMRFAHSEGQTDVCYDDTGRYLLTCGSDGDVRVYDGFDDDDPESFSAGETISAVRFKDERIITASDNSVQIFKFPDGTPDGLITRFTGSVNHLSYSSSGKYLAAGGSDFSIKVVNVEDSSHEYLKGHEAPILSISFDPDEEFVASSSCDGTVKIWHWKEQKCVQTFNLLPKTNDINISKPLCRLAFQPNGNKYLAIPVDKEIKVYERATWKYLFSLKEESSDHESLSIVAWSPCGKYLAAASISGEMIFWHFNSKTVIERTKHDKSLTISCLVWNPKVNGEIAYTDNQGELGVCSDVISKDGKSSGAKKTPASIDNGDEMNVDILLDNNDLDNASETDSLLGAKKRHRVRNSWFDDEADEQGGDDDENTTDLGRIKAELAGPMGLEDDESNQMGDDNKSVRSEPSKGPNNIVMQQPQIVLQQPFQPGSTPVHLMHRFMMWNYVGIIRCHSEEEPSSIDIEFHDTSLHHPMHVINHMNYTMAALSETAVLLACQAQDESASKLLCLHFGTWDRSKEWTVSMPDGEDIMAIAVGMTWAAVATNHDMLRVFTIGGLQTHLISLPGSVVCMSGHDQQLMVVYHNGSSALPGYQCLATKLIDVVTKAQVIADERLPLSPKANLSWLGFSIEGTPASVDSLGVVRLLNRSFDNTWSPVANTKKQVNRPSDNHWVIGLTEASEQVRCILCTGSTYPPTLPRPLPSTLPLQLPVCEISTEKGQLEEHYLRSRLLANRLDYHKQCGIPVDENEYEQSQTLTKQLLMKLFALSCKTDRDFRAVETCELLPDAFSVSLAIKYASRNRHMNLAKRLDDLARRKAEEEAAAEEEGEEFSDDEGGEGEECDEDEVEEEQERSHGRNDVGNISLKKGPGRNERRAAMEEDERQVEEEEDEEEEVEDSEMSETDRDVGSSQSATTSSRSTEVGGKAAPATKPRCYNTSLSQGSQSRSNPFKVTMSGAKSTTPSKSGFFGSLEKKKPEKATKSPPCEKPAIGKQGKQLKLFSKKKTKDEKKKNVGRKSENKEPSKPKVSAFQCWLDEMKPFLQDENPNMSEGEVMKMAMKQWRETPKQEKHVWEKKANSEIAPAHQNEEDNKEEKKRKRDDEKVEVNNENVSAMMEEKENFTKKVKTTDVSQNANTKLAGFAFNKTQ